MNIKDIIKSHGFRSGRALSIALDIPERTVQHWTAGTRDAAEWTLKALDDSLLLRELLEGKKTLADVHKAVADREAADCTSTGEKE